ncbi:hypothetical protein DBV08_31485, partial [Rhodococcus sp. KBW08]
MPRRTSTTEEPVVRRFRRRAEITREAILEVPATLFSQTGYAGTSINDILAISETTKGAM